MNKRNTWPRFVVALVVLHLFTLASIMSSFVPQNENTATPYIQNNEFCISEDPLISITHDDDFAALGFEGDGSSGNPYRIEDFNITGGSADLIYISDTRKHFIIENCTLHQGGFSYVAIQLYNVSNAMIYDNEIHDNWHAISIHTCTNVTIQENNITLNQYGIHVYESYNLDILSNDIVNNVQDCITVNVAGDITVNHNILNGTQTNGWMDTIDTGWFENNTSTHSNLGMYFEGSHLVIKNNILANVTYGMRMACVDTLVFNNTFAECDYGFSMLGGNSQTIANNTISDGITAIELDRPNDCLFENNTVSGNDFGVMVVADSERNWFVGNFFDGNTLNAEDNGTDTFFGTNYWSDYIGLDGNGDGIGDTPHPISGTANNEDPHPLMTPTTPRYSTTWIQTPADQHLEFGDAFRYDLNCTVSEPIYWWLSGAFASWFSVDSNGVITNATMFYYELELPLTVWARNIYSFTISATFRIDVNDTLAPTWDEVPTDQFSEFGQVFMYDLNASDASGIDRYWVNDTLNFYINPDYGILESSILTIGTYGLEVRAYDPEDKYVSAIFVVTVDDTTPPWINHPEDIESSEGSSGFVTITWWVNDASPLSYQVFENGIEAQGGIPDIGGNIHFEIVLDNLAAGTHNYTVVVTDGIHTVSDTVLLVVTPSTIPTTPTTSPTTTPTEPGGVLILVAAVGIGGVIVVIVVVLIIRRRK